jgi:hypothetical protein
VLCSFFDYKKLFFGKEKSIIFSNLWIKRMLLCSARCDVIALRQTGTSSAGMPTISLSPLDIEHLMGFESNTKEAAFSQSMKNCLSQFMCCVPSFSCVANSLTNTQNLLFLFLRQ